MTNGSNIVFEENVFIMNLTYNVRSISVEKAEPALSIVKGEHFELIFSGAKARAEYDFSAIPL